MTPGATIQAGSPSSDPQFSTPRFRSSLPSTLSHKRRTLLRGSFLTFVVSLCLTYMYMTTGLESFGSTRASSLDIDETFILPDKAPQTPEHSRYTDRLIHLGDNDSFAPNNVDTARLRYAILIPTFRDHIPLLLKFLQSLKCLCFDYDLVDIHVITSDASEKVLFEDELRRMGDCGPTYGRWKVPPSNANGNGPAMNLVTHNLYDLLPPSIITMTSGRLTPEDTSALLLERNKFQYQSIKKLSAALVVDYDWALWLDSEAIVVRPFSIRETFARYIQNPTVFRSRMALDQNMRSNMASASRTLGRDISSFGGDLWLLDSVSWFIEKPVLNDMVDYVEKAHDEEFWTAWTDFGAPFEILLYNMHIHGRKLETTTSIYSKYAVLEVEREMIRFGMAPAFDEMENRVGTGFLERAWHLLKKPETQPVLSAFLRRYGQRLFRLEDLTVTAPEVIDRFLLDTPVDMLVSGQPPLHEWWSSRLGSSVE